MSNKLEDLGKLMKDNNTQLPVEVMGNLERKCDDITKTFKDNSDHQAGYIAGFEAGYEEAAIEPAKLLFEVFQKHESGLLPDRFVYDKIKMFLYGE